MTMRRGRSLAAAFALAVAVLAPLPTASAHHRQTPPIVRFTAKDDAAWPRLPPWSDRLVVTLPTPSGRDVFLRNRDRVTFARLTNAGTNDDPVESANGVVAWDSDADLAHTGSTGRQIFLWTNGVVTQLTRDPTGTSANPTIDQQGVRVAFESSGDLAGTGSTSRQVFAWSRGGGIVQVSIGRGASGNAAYDAAGRDLVFDSTSDAATGADTGVAQVWLARGGGPAVPLTAGRGASRRASPSPEGRFVVLESTAALASDGRDTGTTEIFLVEVGGARFHQLTNDAAGCSGAGINQSATGWRVGYVCAGHGYYSEFKDPGTVTRFALPFSGGDTPSVLPAGGNFFLVVATTADPFGGPPSPGHELYQLNLFKLPGVP